MKKISILLTIIMIMTNVFNVYAAEYATGGFYDVTALNTDGVGQGSGIFYFDNSGYYDASRQYSGSSSGNTDTGGTSGLGPQNNSIENINETIQTVNNNPNLTEEEKKDTVFEVLPQKEKKLDKSKVTKINTSSSLWCWNNNQLFKLISESSIDSSYNYVDEVVSKELYKSGWVLDENDNTYYYVNDTGAWEKKYPDGTRTNTDAGWGSVAEDGKVKFFTKIGFFNENIKGKEASINSPSEKYTFDENGYTTYTK